MKKTLYVFGILLCLFLPARSVAQSTFAPVGAEWWHAGYSSFINDAADVLLHARVDSETVIDGHTCRIIHQQRMAKTAHAPATSFPFQFSWSAADTNDYDLYVYDNADTVFLYNSLFNRFTPLYVFNVQEHDTVCLPVIDGLAKGNPHAGGDTAFCFIIDSIRMVSYDNNLLKTFYTRALFDSLNQLPPNDFPVCNWSFRHTLTGAGAYAEKIGGLYAGLLPLNISLMSVPFDGVDADGLVQLNCYSDSTTNIKLSQTACDYMPSTELFIGRIPEEEVNIFVAPNPSRGQFSILFGKALQKDVSIDISDLSGRHIRSFLIKAGKTRLDCRMPETDPGVYVMALMTDSRKYYKKIVIQH